MYEKSHSNWAAVRSGTSDSCRWRRFFLFREELGILASLKRLEGGRPVYTLRIEGDYHFDEFLAAGGASSDQEVSVFLAEKISKGFYSVPVEESGTGCSTLSAFTAGGGHIWGRNYDWTASVPILVTCVPEEGYASISTCDFQNVTGDPAVLPEGLMNQMLAIAALYVPLDGVNEAGLCVADLEVNEGGMPDPDTEKPDLTITTAIRLLLNQAASVDEAVALLEQYDIHPSGGISHHLAISDASGTSVAVEFTDEGLAAVPTPVVTNFNLANGDTAAGGESAQKRYEQLLAFETALRGQMDEALMREAMACVTQIEGPWTTQWSMVYSQGHISYYFDGINGELDCDFLLDEVLS